MRWSPMRVLRVGSYSLLGMVALVATSDGAVLQRNASHAHIGHVTDRWNDTPEQKGLLPSASDEAGIVSQHASLAVSSPDNLASIKRHIGHVMNAVDPGVEPCEGIG